MESVYGYSDQWSEKRLSTPHNFLPQISSVMPDMIDREEDAFIFPEEVPVMNTLKDVMKKVIMAAIGLLLFAASYYHVRQQAEVFPAKTGLPASGYNSIPTETPANAKPAASASYQMVRSSL